MSAAHRRRPIPGYDPSSTTGRPTALHSSAGLRDALLAIGVLMTALVFIELAVPSSTAITAASVFDGIAVGAFTVAGLIAWQRRPHNRTGRLMVATAAALLIGGMSDDEVPALRIVGRLAESLPFALLLHLLLAFPSGRVVGRPARITVAVGYVVALGLQYPQRLVSPEAADALWTVQATLGLATLISAFVLVSRRLATAPRMLRRELAPFIGAGCLMLVIVVGSIVVLHTDPQPGVADVATLVQVATVSLLPVAFVIGLLAGSFGRAGELDELARGISAASADPSMLDELVVRALGDRSARVWWTLDDGLVDSAGRPPTTDDERRGWWPIGPSDAPVGTLSYDRSLIADTGLIAAVSGPLALAIDNRRLVVDLRAANRELDAAADQVRLSRRRIVVAADAERRRIARDLHDGPQQRIVLIGIEAQRLVRRATDPGFVRELAETVSEQLRLLLDDLRGLVHGIMPATLAERGLPAAVAVLADQLPVPVRVRVDPAIGRLPADVESTGWFVVAEALTNAVKHAGAQRITLDVRSTGDRLEVVVADDGVGPGDAEPGFGLRSLRDRVEALDGTVTLTPGAVRGSVLRAEFACA